MQTKTTPSRISWIDMAKGYGTILVIYAHLGQGPLWTWMYSFHLPLFFFLSGYVFNTKHNFENFLLRKVKSIVIPYFCLGIPMVVFALLKDTIKSGMPLRTDDIISYIRALLLQKRLWTLWFMACLFYLNILFYLLVKLCRKNWTILLFSMILPLVGLHYYAQGGTPMYWNVDVCMMAIPFFALGYVYKLHTDKIDDLFLQKKRSIITFLILAIVNVICWRLSLDEKGLGLEMFQSNYGNPVFTYIAAFAGIFCVVILSKWITLEPIRYIGENSMIYYAWHQTIMIPIIAKIMEVITLNSLMSFGEIGIVTYKWISMVGMVLVLTICNWCIGKLGLKFVVGK